MWLAMGFFFLLREFMWLFRNAVTHGSSVFMPGGQSDVKRLFKFRIKLNTSHSVQLFSLNSLNFEKRCVNSCPSSAKRKKSLHYSVSCSVIMKMRWLMMQISWLFVSVSWKNMTCHIWQQSACSLWQIRNSQWPCGVWGRRVSQRTKMSLWLTLWLSDRVWCVCVCMS